MCMLKMSIFIKYDWYFVGQVWFFNHLIKVTNPTCAVMLLEGGKVGKESPMSILQHDVEPMFLEEFR